MELRSMLPMMPFPVQPSFDVVDRVVGGLRVQPLEIPYIVGLRRNRKDQLFCGGSIINALWILTAAHCVQMYRGNPAWVKVTAGSILRVGGSAYKQERKVDKIIIHEKYEHHFIEGGYDIALVKLKDRLNFTKAVNSIPLPHKMQDWEGYAQVSGWGLLKEESRKGADRLMTVKVDIVPNNECVSAYKELYNLTSTMLCAGGEDGQDACKGDSGGPLTCNNNTVLCGIVSFGEGCGRYPGIYTDVSIFTEWIESNVNKTTKSELEEALGEISALKKNITQLEAIIQHEASKGCTCRVDEVMTSSTANARTLAPTAATPTLANLTVLAPVVDRENKCRSQYFYCWEDHSCISRKLICDKKNDCSSGSDETNCTKYPSAWQRDNSFICSNGEPYGYYYFCTGRSECKDNSDEAKCDFTNMTSGCSTGKFTCVSDGRCVPESWIRDGVVDCDDGSDEDNFIPMPTNLTELVKAYRDTVIFKKGWSMAFNRDYFLCDNIIGSKCIRNKDVCNGEKNCPTGEDEEGCRTTTHFDKNTYFHCRNGQRVQLTGRCDGKIDCDDGSDEINCYKLESIQHSFKIY